MPHATDDVWEVLSTARSIRRFTDQPVDDRTLGRCLEAATWAPNGANAQLWRFVVLDAAEQRAAVAEAARLSLTTIESIYGMSRPTVDVVFRNHWDHEHADIVYGGGARPEHTRKSSAE